MYPVTVPPVNGWRRPRGRCDPVAMLSAREVGSFVADGYIAIPGAVPADVVRACREMIWSDLARQGVTEDPGTWTEPVVRIRPGARVFGHPLPGEVGPDHLPAGPHDVGGHRPGNGDVPVGDEGPHLAGAEHGDRIASPPRTPPSINRRHRDGVHPCRRPRVR